LLSLYFVSNAPSVTSERGHFDALDVGNTGKYTKANMIQFRLLAQMLDTANLRLLLAYIEMPIPIKARIPRILRSPSVIYLSMTLEPFVGP
jgi:hypothetical protein